MKSSIKALMLCSMQAIRYSNEIYTNARANSHGIELRQILCGSVPLAGTVGDFVLSTAFAGYGEYDIVHNAAGYPFFPLRGVRGVLIASALELQPILFPEFNRLLTRTAKERLWYHIAVMPAVRSIFSSDYIIANSKLTFDGAVKYGFPRNKTFLVPHGVDRKFRETKIPAKSNRRFKVGTIGTSSPHKNTMFLIDSFKKLRDDKVDLEIWGKSVYTHEELKTRIGGDGRIKVMGYVPEGRMISTYDTFDVFAFPSIYEGFGIPIIEAKARGLPVVLYKKGHISEEVRRYCFEARDEQDMADIIERIKANGYNSKLQKKAIADARSFTWEKAAEGILDVYRKVT